MEISEIQFLKSTSKNNINKLSAAFDDQLIFYIYRELEDFIKKTLILLINNHLKNDRKNCGLISSIAKMITEKQKNLKIVSPFSFLSGVAIEKIWENTNIGLICDKKFFKNFLITDDKAVILKRWINEKTTIVRNKYAHTTIFDNKQRFLIKEDTFRFEISQIIENISCCIETHECF